ncbi:MAG TPA: phosphatase PAP2 family protein [Steroidobacteraceae bacterium]|nr:phosphatase PAP2 family protein [Steroidobacteraceae bacterium]
MRPRLSFGLFLGSLLLALTPEARAGFDHEIGFDQSGIWARSYQTDLEYGVIAVEVAGALWFGNDREIGHTFWQTIDSSIISGLGADLLKYATSRPRPNQGNDPNAWFKGHGYESFPSGEVTLQASFVTPFIANYARREPWIWALEALPLYDSIARLKSHAHWQSDVIAGWALGSGVGYWIAQRDTPFSVQILPKGLSVGFYKRF